MVEGLPAGVIAAMRTAPWGDIAVTVTSRRNPADAFVVDPATLEVTRWTDSETGGLDPGRNAEARAGADRQLRRRADQRLPLPPDADAVRRAAAR